MQATYIGKTLFLFCAGLGLSLLAGLPNQDQQAWGATPVSLAPSTKTTEHQVHISIKTRKFQPDHIVIPLGKKTRLILENLDTELHAFLPVSLLQNTHLNVTGNGAPQFGKSGLIRVLLPSRGQTEIVFVPSKPGNYPFLCDLPGHVMRGNIVVEEKSSVVE